MTVRRTTGPFRPTAPASRYLWHLMRHRFKLDTFLRGGLWLARIDTFNDPREGSLPNPNLGLLNTLLPAFQVPEVLRQYELGVTRAYASCWHMSDGDPSTHAWETFSDPTAGCAIRTTAATIRSSLASIWGPDGPVHFGQVRYIDHVTDLIPDGNIIEAAFTIRRAFAGENEARILVHTNGTAASDRLLPNRGPFGMLIKVDPPSTSVSGKHEFVGGHNQGLAIVAWIDPAVFIDEIVIHPRMTQPNRQRLVDFISQFGLEAKVRS